MYLTVGGKKLRHKKVCNNRGKKIFTRMAKLIRIIGDPDNQRLAKWSSTGLRITTHHGKTLREVIPHRRSLCAPRTDTSHCFQKTLSLH
jgi:hypothetical protein